MHKRQSDHFAWASFFARFLGALLISAQLVLGLPPLAADTLRTSQEAETRQAGLEEALVSSVIPRPISSVIPSVSHPFPRSTQAGLEQQFPLSGLEEKIFSYPRTERERERLGGLISRLDQKIGKDWDRDKAQAKVAEIMASLEKFLSDYADYNNEKHIKDFADIFLSFPFNRDALFELLERIKDGSPEVLEDLRGLLNYEPPLEEDETIREKYYLGDATAFRKAKVRDIFLNLKGIDARDIDDDYMEGIFQVLEKLLRETSLKRANQIRQLKEKIRKTEKELAELSQWDFLHRFKGAQGITLFHGAAGNLENLMVGKKRIRFIHQIYLTMIPGYAQSFVLHELGQSKGVVVGVYVPVQFIHYTSWIYQPTGKPYESEILASGSFQILRMFRLENIEDFLEWLSYEKEYMQELMRVPDIDTRDLAEMEKQETKRFPGNREWLTYSMYMKFSEIIGGILQTGQETLRAFKDAVGRAFQIYGEDYSKVIEEVKRVIEEASYKPQRQINDYLQSQFRGGLEENILKVPGDSPQASRVVIGPSALEQVPGLEQAVKILKAAGLEENIIVLPDIDRVGDQLTQRLTDLITPLLSNPNVTFTAYATPEDVVMKKFIQMAQTAQVPVSWHGLNGLHPLVIQILTDLGIPQGIATREAGKIISFVGLDEAA